MSLIKVKSRGTDNVSGRRNIVINGAMNVAQRATSEADIGGAGKYPTVDRFKIVPNGTNGRVTMSQDSSAPSGFANSLKLDVTTADTSVVAGEYFLISHKIEGQNLQQFAKGTSDAKPFAVSFYVKGNASATYACELFDSNSRQASKLFNVTTDWTRVELIFDADTTGTIADDSAQGLEINFWLHAGTSFTSGTLNQTFASNDNTKRASGISSIFDSTDRTFFLTGVQLEVGDSVSDFEHRSIGEEFALCQRYFYQEARNADNIGGKLGIAVSNTVVVVHPLPEKMRAKPSVSLTTAAIRVGDMVAFGQTITSGGGISLSSYSGSQSVTYSLTGFSGLTNYRTYLTEPRNSDGATGIVKFDAEL